MGDAARAADVHLDAHRLCAGIDGLEYELVFAVVPASQRKKPASRARRLVVDQFAVQVTADAVLLELQLDVVPTVRLDAAGDMPAKAALIELYGMLRVSPAADVPPVSLLAFAAECNQKTFGAAEFSRLQRQGVVAPMFVAEKAQPYCLLALPVSSIHYRPGAAVGSPAFGSRGKIRGIKNPPIFLDANVFEFRRRVPGPHADAAGDGCGFFRCTLHHRLQRAGWPVQPKQFPQVIGNRSESAGGVEVNHAVPICPPANVGQ